MTQTRTVKFMVTREEVWFPEYDVPAHMTDDEALEYIKAEDGVFRRVSEQVHLRCGDACLGGDR